MSSARLKGRTALVTGAAGGIGGIGHGVALALAAEGANVAMLMRSRVTDDVTASNIGEEAGRALAIECDITVRDDVESAISATVSAFSGLDIVVHSAVNREGGIPLPLQEVTDRNWHVQATVSWEAAYFLAHAAFPLLRQSRHARFIVFGACAGLQGGPMNSVYSAIKGGVRGFVKALAREWAPYQITVNAVEPAAAERPSEIFVNLDPRVVAQFMTNFPMGRLGRPREDIGRAVVALCSDQFGFVTAQSIQVDGGLYTAI